MIRDFPLSTRFGTDGWERRFHWRSGIGKVISCWATKVLHSFCRGLYRYKEDVSGNVKKCKRLLYHFSALDSFLIQQDERKLKKIEDIPLNLYCLVNKNDLRKNTRQRCSATILLLSFIRNSHPKNEIKLHVVNISMSVASTTYRSLSISLRSFLKQMVVFRDICLLHFNERRLKLEHKAKRLLFTLLLWRRDFKSHDQRVLDCAVTAGSKRLASAGCQKTSNFCQSPPSRCVCCDARAKGHWQKHKLQLEWKGLPSKSNSSGLDSSLLFPIFFIARINQFIGTWTYKKYIYFFMESNIFSTFSRFRLASNLDNSVQ